MIIYDKYADYSFDFRALLFIFLIVVVWFIFNKLGNRKLKNDIDMGLFIIKASEENKHIKPMKFFVSIMFSLIIFAYVSIVFYNHSRMKHPEKHLKIYSVQGPLKKYHIFDHFGNTNIELSVDSLRFLVHKDENFVSNRKLQKGDSVKVSFYNTFEEKKLIDPHFEVLKIELLEK